MPLPAPHYSIRLAKKMKIKKLGRAEGGEGKAFTSKMIMNSFVLFENSYDQGINNERNGRCQGNGYKPGGNNLFGNIPSDPFHSFSGTNPHNGR